MAVLFNLKINLSGESMVVYTTFPHDHPTELVHCIICYELVPLLAVTAGSLRADGSQAFACDRHLYNREAWIIAWALFDIEQEAMTHVTQYAEQAT